MARRACPKGVQRARRGDGTWRYRAWGLIGGLREYGRWTEDLEQATLDARRMRRGEWTPANQITIGEAMDLVVEQGKIKGLSQATIGWYEDQFEVLKGMLRRDLPLERIDARAIERFVRWRMTDQKVKADGKWYVRPAVTAATIAKHRSALSRLFTVAEKHGWRGRNPCREVEWPRAKTAAMDCFTAAEVREVLAKIRGSGEPAAEAEADLVAMAYLTGLRRAEIARLRVRDVDLEGARVYVRGKRGEVEIPLGAEVVEVLCRMVGRLAPVVEPEEETRPAANGRHRVSEARRGGKGKRTGRVKEDDRVVVPGGVKEVARVFRRWKDRLQEPRLHAHAMRHSFVTALVGAGHDIGVVQRLSRHRTTAMVTRYLHASGPAVRAAMDSLRLQPQAPEPAGDQTAEN